jgi:hypothetical protein
MSHRISNLTRPSGGQVVGDLPPGELEELAARSTEVTVEPGANVITLDD